MIAEMLAILAILLKAKQIYLGTKIDFTFCVCLFFYFYCIAFYFCFEFRILEVIQKHIRCYYI